MQTELEAAGKAISGVADRERFFNSGDGTFTDRGTGLVWFNSAKYFGLKTWEDALDLAADLESGLAGISDGSHGGDWRLPTRNELETLVGSFKANLKQCWSMSVKCADIDRVWSVNTGSGAVTDKNKKYFCYVWPVRREKA